MSLKNKLNIFKATSVAKLNYEFKIDFGLSCRELFRRAWIQISYLTVADD